MNRRLIDGRFVVDVDQHLAEGGMGSIYRASDSFTNSACAIKTLIAARRDDSIGILAMRRELESLQSLEHRNIVRFIASGEDEKLGKYVAIEWMKEDLKTKCRNKPYADWDTFWAAAGQPIL